MHGFIKKAKCEEIRLEEVQHGMDSKAEEDVRAMIGKLDHISGDYIPK